VPPFGTAHLIVVDALKAGPFDPDSMAIAWRVNLRLVGTPSWVAFDQERILDGRKNGG